ncbi:MAG: M20/M25/M40 family metallo-hydrolase [Candidatus Thermoplasmatota archaeon]|nr:M20/M25/M40 family metallo-hydrolase [Candidatus Thermoplasmatota archaeon]MCL5889512.1 M20/M25/M40 family metallo-hydrolase [Candidatus Thermoplasmatota archaeon]
MNDLDYFISKKDEMLNAIGELVKRETFSQDKGNLDEFSTFLQGMVYDRLKLKPEIMESEKFGNILIYTINPEAKEQVLVLCHYDTVFPSGTLQKNPFSINNEIATGPGIFDMKSGIIFALYAIGHFVKYGNNNKKIVIMFTADEEIGSSFSRKFIEEQAAKSKYAIVLESSLGGKIKTERRGVMGVHVDVAGRSAHAGLDPEKGINAIYEATNIVENLRKMSKEMKGEALISVGKIGGGTASNVVPDNCFIDVDVRFGKDESCKKIIERLKSIKPLNSESKINITHSIREAMPRTAETAALFGELKKRVLKLDVNLEETSVSGASDGNICARFCPVLDGMGAFGNGAHSLKEYIDIDQIPLRTVIVYYALDL